MENRNGRTAIIIGATGLVGSQLMHLLLNDDRFSGVIALGRRSCGIRDRKLKEHIISFDKPGEWRHLLHGDVLYSTLGTTLKAAGSKEAQYKIDYTYQYEVAKGAAQNGVPAYALVSSAMASDQSRFFYMRMKGELERDIRQLPFQRIRILQPGMLAGARKEKRTGERIGLFFVRFVNRLGLLKSQTPVDASIVARALVNTSFDNSDGVKVYALGEVLDAGKG